MISRMSHEVATSAGDPFAASSRVANATGLGPLRHVEVTGSTNVDLVAEARAGVCGPVVLVADHQSAGRGRLGREWDDDSGHGLLVSIRVPASLEGVAAVVAAVGAAARLAADQLTTSTGDDQMAQRPSGRRWPGPGKTRWCASRIRSRSPTNQWWWEWASMSRRLSVRLELPQWRNVEWFNGAVSPTVICCCPAC